MKPEPSCMSTVWNPIDSSHPIRIDRCSLPVVPRRSTPGCSNAHIARWTCRVPRSWNSTRNMCSNTISQRRNTSHHVPTLRVCAPPGSEESLGYSSDVAPNQPWPVEHYPLWKRCALRFAACFRHPPTVKRSHPTSPAALESDPNQGTVVEVRPRRPRDESRPNDSTEADATLSPCHPCHWNI